MFRRRSNNEAKMVLGALILRNFIITLLTLQKAAERWPSAAARDQHFKLKE
jgi:hypothetical protein